MRIILYLTMHTGEIRPQEVQKALCGGRGVRAR